MSRERRSVIDRLLGRVVKSGECWIFTGAKNRHGYGVIGSGGKYGKNLFTHRVTYAHFIGPIPDGLSLDHLCRVPSCCNPEHLEPVTQRVNLRRSPITVTSINAAKTHCKHGHAFTSDNTYTRRNGTRQCRTCVLASNRRSAQKRKSA